MFLLHTLLEFEYQRTPFLVKAVNIYLKSRHENYIRGTSRMTISSARRSLEILRLLLKCGSLQHRTFNRMLEAVLLQDLGLPWGILYGMVNSKEANEGHMKLEPRIAHLLVDTYMRQVRRNLYLAQSMGACSPSCNSLCFLPTQCTYCGVYIFPVHDRQWLRCLLCFLRLACCPSCSHGVVGVASRWNCFNRNCFRVQAEARELPMLELLQTTNKQTIFHIPLARLAMCTLWDGLENYGETTEPAVSQGGGKAMSAPDKTESCNAVAHRNSNGLPQEELPSPAADSDTDVMPKDDDAVPLTVDGGTATVCTSPATLGPGLEAEAAGEKAAPADALSRLSSGSSVAGGGGNVLAAPAKMGHEPVLQPLGSPVHADAGQEPRFHPPTMVLDPIPYCQAVEGVALMFYQALTEKAGSRQIAQEFADSVGMTRKWLLQVISGLSWRLRAVHDSDSPELYRGLLLKALLAVGQIAHVMDRAVTRDAEMRLSKECAKECEALIEDMLQCLAVEVAKLEAVEPIKACTGTLHHVHPGCSTSLSISADPAHDVLTAVKAMELLGWSESCVIQLLRSTVGLFLASQHIPTIGACLRLYDKYSIVDYSAYDHYFSMVVDQQMELGKRNQQLKLLILGSALSALRVQYMPGESVRQVIAEFALSTINNNSFKVRLVVRKLMLLCKQQ